MFITFSAIEFQRGVRDLERLSGLKDALEAGQDGGPPLGDAFEKLAALGEAFMGQGQLDELAIWLKDERRERGEFVSKPVRLIHESIGQPSRRGGFCRPARARGAALAFR